MATSDATASHTNTRQRWSHAAHWPSVNRASSAVDDYCIAKCVGQSSITVNAVCPDYIEGTPMLRSAIANVVRATGKSEDEARAILAKPSPDGRFISMDEVAAKVLWLCSADASATTGQAVTVGSGEALS
jgi:NAD(P)-dependent dehydrogenase (short-subunit alcohol dehydrogenase family)